MNKTDSQILLVEDEDIVAGFIECALEEQHIGVVRVATAAAAWTELNRGETAFGAILLDRQLPDEDGLSLLKQIKSKPELHDTPVIMETAENDPESIREGLAAGAYYYLTKPLEPKMLWAVVEAALGQSRTQVEMQDAAGDESRSLASLESGLFRFRTLAEAKELAQVLAHACPDPARAVIGLQEILVNAVEHGNLGITYAEKTQLLLNGTWAAEIEKRLANPAYKSKSVTVKFARDGKVLTLLITDEGAGFDWKKYLEFDAKRALDPHGRGIAMARMMSLDTIEFMGNGNTVRIKVGMPVVLPF